jgi:hypothetical protein
MKTEITPEMRRCLERINEASGTITRYPGGFWYPKEGMASFGTTTVEALVKRGKLEYCEWKEYHGRKFPIKAKMANPPNKQWTPRYAAYPVSGS